jgi:hypothetical protein
MNQSRLGSFTEACVNTTIGYCISVFANLYVLPLFGLQVSLNQALGIGLVFTIIAVARSYAIRRLFNLTSRWQAGE